MIVDGARYFEDFDGVTFLNCASMGPLPKVTVEAVEEALPLKVFPNRIPDDILFRIPNGVRAAVAPLIGANPEDIFIGNGASHAVNVAALGFPWKEGDEVVVASNDFPSNVYIWGEAARRNGGKLVLVESDRKAATTEDMLAAMTPKTRILAVSYVDFGTGELIDLERVATICRDRDIFLIVDATQAVGVVPIDVKDLGISMLAAGAYKWLLSPYGAGFGWLNPEWAGRIEPRYITWTAAEGAENFNSLPRGDWDWVKSNRRYDGPEAASFLNMSGLTRSAQFIDEIGLQKVHEHVTGLLSALERQLPSGYRRRATTSRTAAPILCLESDDVPNLHRVYEKMRADGIWTALREDGIRVSPHIYNTEADIERLLGYLAGP